MLYATYGMPLWGCRPNTLKLVNNMTEMNRDKAADHAGWHNHVH